MLFLYLFLVECNIYYELKSRLYAHHSNTIYIVFSKENHHSPSSTVSLHRLISRIRGKYPETEKKEPD